MDRDTWLAKLKTGRAIAIVRAPHWQTGLHMARAAVAGGFRLIEITWTSDRPGQLITALRAALPADCCVGVGTILNVDDLRAAIAAGAQFCFMPHTEVALIRLGQAHGLPMVPGALTPTEIMQAWQQGVSSVKVFPCESVGGAAYIRHLQGPLRHIPLIPTGGVTVENGHAYLTQGAIAIGIASSLFPPACIAAQNWEGIQRRSHTFLSGLQAP